MNPNYIAEEDLESGRQKEDMLAAMLKLILYTADSHAKATKLLQDCVMFQVILILLM
jgi:hypothetical protein